MGWPEFTLKLFETLFIHFAKIAAWPLAVVCLGYFFRNELREFLSRATEIGLKGAKAVPPQVQSPAPKISNTIEVVGKPLPPTTRFIAQREEVIVAEVNRLGYEKPQLIREFVLEQIKGHFRVIASAIYGSQLALLDEIRNKGSIKYDDAIKFYEIHKSKAAARSMSESSFSEWSNYLVVSGLMEIDQGTYKLTDAGSDFVNLFAPSISLTLQSRPL